MNRKGFTLIELLAVIVILAIIALIATPIVMNTIEKSKKGAVERSAENYIEAVDTAIATKRLDSLVLSDGEYIVKNDGNICIDKTASCSEEDELKIEVNGDKPKGGKVVLEGSRVKTVSNLNYSAYVVNTGEKSVVASKPILVTSLTVTYGADCKTNKTCVPTITVEPSNATNKDLVFTMDDSYNNCDKKTSINGKLSIDSLTGKLTKLVDSPFNRNNDSAITINVTATTTDGSNITKTAMAYLRPVGSTCDYIIK